MKRAVVFAHYSKYNIIDDYVIFYLRELRKIAENIVFVSDCNLNDSELNKIKDIVIYSTGERHGEYDFGSYKRGYLYLKENGLLADISELIFVNDSCYGPLYSLETVFCKMQYKDCDFWGINLNEIEVGSHIQSFFLVFRKQVFSADIFDDFVKAVKDETNKSDIIRKYEIGLSQMLLAKGFKMDAFIDAPVKWSVCEWVLSKYNNPFVKKSIVNKLCKIYVEFVFEFIKKGVYSSKLIIQSKDYIGTKKNIFNELKAFRKAIVRIHFSKMKIYLFGHKIQF